MHQEIAGLAHQEVTNAQYLINTRYRLCALYGKLLLPREASQQLHQPMLLVLCIKILPSMKSGHSSVEYKDMDGKVVLKKVQLAATTGTAHVGWLCTYYIYDDLDNLRFVIQPRGVELINSNWTITTAIANELCFRYEYDYRKRMIIKKIPGAGEAWMVYDLRDRLVMTQDCNLRVLA